MPPCPNCHYNHPIALRYCSECGFNQATGQYPQNAQFPGQPGLSAQPPTFAGQPAQGQYGFNNQVQPGSYSVIQGQQYGQSAQQTFPAPPPSSVFGQGGFQVHGHAAPSPAPFPAGQFVQQVPPAPMSYFVPNNPYVSGAPGLGQQVGSFAQFPVQNQPYLQQQQGYAASTVGMTTTPAPSYVQQTGLLPMQPTLHQFTAPAAPSVAISSVPAPSTTTPSLQDTAQGSQQHDAPSRENLQRAQHLHEETLALMREMRLSTSLRPSTSVPAAGSDVNPLHPAGVVATPAVDRPANQQTVVALPLPTPVPVDQVPPAPQIVVPITNIAPSDSVPAPQPTPGRNQSNFPPLAPGQPPDLSRPNLDFAAAIATAPQPPPANPASRFVLTASKPHPPCGPNNLDAWPQDHHPLRTRFQGIVRMKEFPGCKCPCGKNHPVAIGKEARQMFEAWRPKGNGKGNCSNCKSSGHFTEECGLGEWRDCPDNHPLPDAHREANEQFLRPWPQGAKLVPFPLHYYVPATRSRPSSFPILPEQYRSTGMPYGLVDTGKGIQYALEWVAADEAKAKKKQYKYPQWDHRVYQPYHIWPASKEKNPDSSSKDVKKQPRNTKSQTQPTQPEGSGYYKNLELLDQTDDGFREVEHPPALPSPEYWLEPKVPDEYTWFSKRFLTAMMHVLIAEDSFLLSKVSKRFTKDMDAHRTCRNGKSRSYVLKDLADGWDLVSIYIPWWSPQDRDHPFKAPDHLEEELKPRREKYADTTKWQFPGWVTKGTQPTPTGPAVLRVRAKEWQPCGFRSWTSTSYPGRTWADVDDLEDRDSMHPEVPPQENFHAKTHCDDWISFTTFNVEPSKLNDWRAWAWEIWCEKVTLTLRFVLFRPELKANADKIQEGFDTLFRGYTNNVIEICNHLRGLCAFRDGNAGHDLKAFETLKTQVRKHMDDYELKNQLALDHAFGDRGIIGPDFFNSLNKASQDQCDVQALVAGALLPAESELCAQIPRLVFPLELEKYCQQQKDMRMGKQPPLVERFNQIDPEKRMEEARQDLAAEASAAAQKPQEEAATQAAAHPS